MLEVGSIPGLHVSALLNLPLIWPCHVFQDGRCVCYPGYVEFQSGTLTCGGPISLLGNVTSEAGLAQELCQDYSSYFDQLMEVRTGLLIVLVAVSDSSSVICCNKSAIGPAPQAVTQIATVRQGWTGTNQENQGYEGHTCRCYMA